MKPIPDEPCFFQQLYALDEEAFRELKAHPCPKCGGKMDTANISRKLRGNPKEEGVTRRFGLCCRKCRKRRWPPSLRFLGRKVYSAWTVILALEFQECLGLSHPVSRRTLSRWRNFWRDRLAEASPFMRWARAKGQLLIPQAGESPARILAAFEFPEPKARIPALKFFTQFSLDPK